MSALVSILPPDGFVVITDTETTGLHAKHNRIIELAALKITDDGRRDMFSQLINPGLAIPSRITRITGITTSMVYGQPSAEEVMPRFREFLLNGVFVAHNIRFDVSFINAEYERISLPDMDNSGLCTLRLARRLLPGLRSKSLANLARFFRIPSQGRHRAERDVEITAEILERLAQIAVDDHDVTSLGELMELQARTYSRVNPISRHVVEIKKNVLPDVPAVPGVYFMEDGRKKVLYVGKAKNLSKRVASYFTAIEAHPPRLRQLISKVRNVSWEQKDTELHALIDESRLIKELDPPFNRAQKKYIPRPYLRLSTEESYPRLTVQVIVRDDGAEYYGPLRSRSQARTIVEISEHFFPLRTCSSLELARARHCVRHDIGLCPAPCEYPESADSYRETVDEVKSFLSGEIDEVCSSLEESMMEASQNKCFEEAARLRDWIQLLDSRLVGTGAVAAAVNGPDQIYFQMDEDTQVLTMTMVSGGRIVLIESPQKDYGVNEIVGMVVDALSPDGTERAVMDRIQTDARRILDHWLYVNRTSVTSLERRGDESAAEFAARAGESIINSQSTDINA